MIPLHQKGLGALPKPIDIRDFSFADAPVPQLGTVPSLFIPTIYDQNKVPNCGPEMLNFRMNFLNPGIIGSPKFVSKQTRLLDNLPSNFGTNLRTLYKAAKNSGTCDLTLMPDDTHTDTLDDYWSPNGITRQNVINASTRTIHGYGFKEDDISFDQIQNDLEKFGMIECRILLGNGFFTDLSRNQISYDSARIFPLQLGTYIDEHFIELLRPDIAEKFGIFNPNPNYIYWATQWGTGYGARGIGWMDASYIPYIKELGVSW